MNTNEIEGTNGTALTVPLLINNVFLICSSLIFRLASLLRKIVIRCAFSTSSLSAHAN
jgi:hypothetical protein